MNVGVAFLIIMVAIVVLFFGGLLVWDRARYDAICEVFGYNDFTIYNTDNVETRNDMIRCYNLDEAPTVTELLEE